MDDSELSSDLVAAIEGVLQRELRPVGPVNESGTDIRIGYTHSFPAAVVSFEPLFRLILSAAGALKEEGFERTAWLFHFTFDGQRCRLRCTRSGIYLDLAVPMVAGKAPERTAADVELRLVNAARQLYRRVVAPRANRKISKGEVTVMNQYGRYRGMVDFYLDEIQRPRSPEQQLGDFQGDTVPEMIRLMSKALEPLQLSREQAYRATALVAGYFSWVQHLLVALTAFSPKALSEDFSITQTFAAPWAEQFDNAYPSPQSSAVIRLKSELASLARTFRNPLLHGGGGRYEDGIVVEWAPGQQIIAVDPNAATDLYMLWQPALEPAQVADLVDRIAKIDEALSEHPYFEWVKGGLPVSFGHDDVRKALCHLQNGTVMDYIEETDNAYDRYVNWD